MCVSVCVCEREHARVRHRMCVHECEGDDVEEVCNKALEPDSFSHGFAPSFAIVLGPHKMLRTHSHSDHAEMRK